MNAPDMSPVQSSNVESVGYDDQTNTLYVSFLNGTLYSYSNVPYVIYEQLLNADSVGSYLHRNIKGIYPYNRIY